MYRLKSLRLLRTALLVAVLCFVLGPWDGAGAKALKWKTFSNKKGSFSVSIPNLKVSNGGSENSWEVEVKDKDGLTIEIYSFDYMDEDFSKGGQDDILKGNLESIHQLSHPVSIGQTDTTYQGFACRQYDYIEPQGPYEAIRHIRRLIMTTDRVFTLDYMRVARDLSDNTQNISNLKTDNLPNAKSFLDSLKINR